MAVNQESLNKKLYDLLKTKGYQPIPKNTKNQRTESPQEADVFNFTYKKQGEDIGDAWITIDDVQDVILYYDGDLFDKGGRSEKSEFDDSWTGFVQQLKRWAMTKQLGFELRDKNKLGDDMAQREYIMKKETISEGYYPMGKQSSYSDNIPTVKIVLQHTRQIQEGEQRYRNIARIYLENQQGERILAPTVRPGIAQVYARHLAEGGLPNDERWNHIKSLCEEYNKMAGFVRATRNNQFSESAQSLINEGVNHYQNLRETLGKMRSNRGYHKYFESFTPTLMETENDTSSLNELFVQEKLDPRIETVLPILSKLHKKLDEMKEVQELDEWAGTVLELDQKPKMSREKFQEISKKIQDIQMNPKVGTDPALKAQLAKAKAMLRKKAEEAGFEIAKEGWNDHLDDPNVGNEYWHDRVDAYRDQNKELKPTEPKSDEEVKEDLGPEQKRVGQLGPTEKVKNNNIGKLVGASESVEAKLKAITEMDKSQPSSDRGGESSGDPYAKGGKATPAKAKDAAKDAEDVLNKAMDKAPPPDKTKKPLKEDSDEARELELFATNDSDLYRQSYLPIVKNLERKFKKGVYDKELAKKLWVLHAARAAKKYGQEHGNDDGLTIFSPVIRREVAAKLADDHFAEMEAGNFHDVEKSKDDFPFSGGKPAKGTVTDKSGAQHTPMSRAKDLAQKGKDSVKEEDMAEGLGKNIKRAIAGWGAFDKDKPSDIVNRTKSQDTATLKGLSNSGPTGKGSPAELQQKAIKRELKRRGEQGVAEGQEDLDFIKRLIK